MDPAKLSTGDLSWSTIYSLLSHSERRALLEVLNRNENPMAVADAAEEVVRLNSDTADEIDRSSVKQCSLSLHHRHVPVLADEGFVTVEDDGTLNLTEKGEQLTAAQRLLEGRPPEYP